MFNQILFGPRSPWNIIPINPVFGTGQLPAANNWPKVEDGAYSSQIFVATGTEKPMTIKNVWVGDELRTRDVVLAHFPTGVLPATGTDGHCSIYDPSVRALHSFYKLKNTSGVWSASKYTFWPIDGMGWPSPERPDGATASGAPHSGGQMRSSEINYIGALPHALAIAMDHSAMLSGPVCPATQQDINGNTYYSAVSPNGAHMGSLWMLPASFDESKLTNPKARIIAKTLKLRGGYIIDTTTGAFTISAEIGSGWSPGVGSVDLNPIRAALRQVVKTSGWKDANGVTFTPTPWANMNLLSMRGKWLGFNNYPNMGGTYNTATGFVSAPASTAPTVTQSFNLIERNDTTVNPWFGWSGHQTWYVNPTPGRAYKLTATGSGGPIYGFLQIKDSTGTRMTTNVLFPGNSQTFVWPARVSAQTTVCALGKKPGAAGTFRFELVGQ